MFCACDVCVRCVYISVCMLYVYICVREVCLCVLVERTMCPDYCPFHLEPFALTSAAATLLATKGHGDPL